MELMPIKGDTHIIVENTTVIGVYIFPDRTCLLIDSSPQRRIAQKIYQYLSQEGLKVVGILNTHAHSDHTGGNLFFQQNTGCAIYARPQEAVFMAYPLLQLQMLYTAAIPPGINNRFTAAEPCRVTHFIEPGILEIADCRFEVLGLAGHSVEHCGFITPDGVTFIGDALIAEEIVQEFPYLYIIDLNRHLQTLDYLASAVLGPVITGHGGMISSLTSCINCNLNIISKLLQQYREMLSIKESSREEIIQATLNARVYKPTMIQYYMFFSTVSAYLTYLTQQGVIRSFIKNGVMWYKCYPGQGNNIDLGAQSKP